MVATAVMVLRVKEKNRHRPFKTPAVWLVAPLAVIGTAGLFLFLPSDAQLVFPIWGAVGLVIYFLYGYRHSHVALGIPTESGGEDLLAEVRPLADLDPDCDADRASLRK